MLPQHVSEDLGALRQRDRVREIFGEGGDPGRFPLRRGHLVDVVRGLRRELGLGLDPGQPCRQHGGEGQVGVASRIR